MQKPSVLLIVEDNTGVRDVVVEILVGEGYEIVEARNGEEGLAALSVKQPNLILLDLEMPVMTGWAFMKQLKARALSIPVIIMSGRTDWAGRVTQLGAVDFLAKPFDVPELVSKVAKHHKPKPFLS